jgi:cobalt-zinc-cadmium efflux system protein
MAHDRDHHDEGHSHAGHSHAPANFGRAGAFRISLILAYVISQVVFGIKGLSQIATPDLRPMGEL